MIKTGQNVCPHGASVPVETLAVKKVNEYTVDVIEEGIAVDQKKGGKKGREKGIDILNWVVKGDI